MAPDPLISPGSRNLLTAPVPTLSAAWLAAAHVVLGMLMRLIVKLHFRRLRTLHVERFPDRGPVLVVANHPSTWTDVVILDVALGRRLHFLAEEGLYRPRLRGALLALFGSLPVAARREDVDRARRNAETFRRCHALFDRGEVVAIFPEGVSLGDRSLQALKPGAARIALGYEGVATRPLSVVPVGIHYANRTAFRSDVLVHVGRPLPLDAFRRDLALREAAVQALTRRLQGAISELILDLPEALRPVEVESLGRLLSDGPSGDARGFERMRRLVARLDGLRVVDPGRFAVLCRQSWRFHRTCRALALDPRALDVRSTGWRPQLGRGLWGFIVLAGAPPAALGAAIHALPWLLGEALAKRYAPQPSSIAFARIAAGLVLVPCTYVLFALGLAWAGVPPAMVLTMLVAFALLGLWTLRYQGLARVVGEEVRLLVHQRRHPRLVERARRQRQALRTLLEELLGTPDHRRQAGEGSRP